MTEPTEHDVAEAVRRYLQDCHPGGITLEVIEPGIRQEAHWWQVPLRPSAWPEKMFEYYEALADVEAALEEREQLKVLLVPGEPAAVPAG